MRKLKQEHDIFRDRIIGTILFFIAIIPCTLLDGLFRLLIAGGFICGGIIFLNRFRCPYCNHSLDLKVKKADMVYCNKCGKKVN